jgi:hypothetical protein
MDELTAFKSFVKLGGFHGLQNTPDRFESRIHKFFAIRV